MIARWLNRTCGSTSFTPYNVDMIPAVDIMCIARILEVKEDVEIYKAKLNARK